MYFDQFCGYMDQYERGMRKFTYRTTRIELTRERELLAKSIPKAYDLYFSRSGRLTTSYDLRYNDGKPDKITRNSYAYSRDGILYYVLATDCFTNTLVRHITFCYDELKRIELETIEHYCYWSDSFEEQEFFHSYDKGYHKVTFNDHESDEDIRYTIEEWYNDRGDVVEEKRWSSNGGIHKWDKYRVDDSGKIVEEFEVEEDGTLKKVIDPSYGWQTKKMEEHKGYTRFVRFREGIPVIEIEITKEFYL